MPRQMTPEGVKKRNVLIFIGRGKSSLIEKINQHDNFKVIHGVLSEKLYKIHNVFYNDFIIHLDSEKQIKELPQKIRRKALIYKIDF